MTQELTNIIQLIKAKEFELAYQLLIGNPWIYMDCSEEDLLEVHLLYNPLQTKNHHSMNLKYYTRGFMYAIGII